MNFEPNKMKTASSPAKGINQSDLYQGLDYKALIGSSRGPALSIQEQIEAGVKAEKQKVNDVRNSLQEIRTLLGNLAETIQTERKAWFESMQEELVSVVAEVVTNIIEVELVQNKEIIKTCFTKVLKLIEEEYIQKIVINEEDYKIIQQECADACEKLKATNRIEFDVRADVPRGTIQAQSKLLKIDAGVSERLRRFILEAVGGVS